MALTLFSNVLKFFGVGGLANTETGAQYSGPASRQAAESNVYVSDERALAISAVWSCVRLISETVSCLPLKFYERTGDNTRTDLDGDHYIVQLLNRKPNQSMTPTEFREAMTVQLALWGNAYARIGYMGRGESRRPVTLVPLRPEHVTPMRLPDGSVAYHYNSGKGVEVLAAQSVFHLKGFSTEGIIGLSPLAYARNSLGLTVAAEQYSGAQFKNGGRPAGTLTFDKYLNADQREAARQVYQAISEGASEANNAWILEGGAKYEPINIPPDDMQMLESRTFQLGEIARFFRVPSHLINDSAKATSWGTGIEQLNLAFLQYGLNPYLKRWETTITDKLLRRADKQRVISEHSVEGLLRADSKGRSDFYSKAAQNGWMTRNEIRQKENLPPKAGGDMLTVQVNLTPADELPGIEDATQN